MFDKFIRGYINLCKSNQRPLRLKIDHLFKMKCLLFTVELVLFENMSYVCVPESIVSHMNDAVWMSERHLSYEVNAGQVAKKKDLSCVTDDKDLISFFIFYYHLNESFVYSRSSKEQPVWATLQHLSAWVYIRSAFVINKLFDISVGKTTLICQMPANVHWLHFCMFLYLKTRAFVHPNPSTRDSVISKLSALISGTSCLRSQATEGVPMT